MTYKWGGVGGCNWPNYFVFKCYNPFAGVSKQTQEWSNAYVIRDTASVIALDKVI